jgi:hypothetical protein
MLTKAEYTAKNGDRKVRVGWDMMTKLNILCKTVHVLSGGKQC